MHCTYDTLNIVTLFIPLGIFEYKFKTYVIQKFRLELKLRIEPVRHDCIKSFKTQVELYSFGSFESDGLKTVSLAILRAKFS